MITTVLELNLSPLLEEMAKQQNMWASTWQPRRSYNVLIDLVTLYQHNTDKHRRNEIRYLFQEIIDANCLYVRLRFAVDYEEDNEFEYMYGCGLLEEREETVGEYLNRVRNLDVEDDVEW